MSEDYWIPILAWFALVPMPIGVVAAAFWWKVRRDVKDSLDAMWLELGWIRGGVDDG
jgi:hypothetical protein